MNPLDAALNRLAKSRLSQIQRAKRLLLEHGEGRYIGFDSSLQRALIELPGGGIVRREQFSAKGLQPGKSCDLRGYL